MAPDATHELAGKDETSESPGQGQVSDLHEHQREAVEIAGRGELHDHRHRVTRRGPSGLLSAAAGPEPGLPDAGLVIPLGGLPGTEPGRQHATLGLFRIRNTAARPATT